MAFRKVLFLCLAAGVFFLTRPMDTQAAQIDLALAGGISSSFNESATSDSEMAEALDQAVKNNYTGMCIAQVNDYVNIRSEASEEGEVLGKLYDKSVGTVDGEENGWYHITSGNVTGYVKSEYVIIASDAASVAEQVGTRVATVTTETLRVRQEATTDSSILGLIPMGEELTVTDETDGFVKVSIEEGDGWVSKDYVDVEIEYVTAESIEEERARLEEEEQAREEARKAAKAAEEKLRQEEQKRQEQEAAAQEDSGAQQEEAAPEQEEEQKKETVSAPKVSSDGSLGSAVASYATQFVGNPYVYGGTSLTNGADCSGFVMSVYKNFGVSLPHSSSADRHVGYAVGSLAEAQPGDLVCYSGHVGIYIGGGQIVHASTAATGIKISNADYRNPVAIRRIF